MGPKQSRTPRMLFIMAVAIIAVSGCSWIPRNEFRPVASGDDWRVRLTKYSVGSKLIKKGGFEQPFDISLAKLNNILASIYFKRTNVLDNKGERQQLFPKRVRRLLLKPLQDAFKEAKPDEVIDFSFMLGKTYLWVFQHDLFTSGIFFKKDGKLNLVMRVVRFQCDSYHTALRQFVSDPTQKALRNNWEFISVPGLSLKKHKKEGLGLFQESYYTNWLIIEMDRVYKPLRTTVKHFEKLLKNPSAVHKQPGRVDYSPQTPEVVTPGVPKNIDDPEIRKRLRVLRELYNSGAITRSTYERKKEEILAP